MNKLDVDIVFTYVNGNDPNYIRKKNAYIKTDNFIKKYNNEIRSVNINEIIYSVNSVIKFIPWIRKIFIVTDNQIPPIDKELILSKKVVIIDHNKIINNKYLPTFNSDVIESYLHNIPDLSEIFLYNNDDIFHFNYIRRIDIYKIIKDKVKLKINSNFESIKLSDTEFSKRIAYTIDILNQKYPKIKFIFNHHTKILRKSTLKEIEKNNKKILHNMRINKFRNDNYINYLFFAMNIDNLIHRNIISNDYKDIIELSLGDKNFKIIYFTKILNKKPKFVCLNSMNHSFKKPLEFLAKHFSIV